MYICIYILCSLTYEKTNKFELTNLNKKVLNIWLGHLWHQGQHGFYQASTQLMSCKHRQLFVVTKLVLSSRLNHYSWLVWDHWLFFLQPPSNVLLGWGQVKTLATAPTPQCAAQPTILWWDKLYGTEHHRVETLSSYELSWRFVVFLLR